MCTGEVNMRTNKLIYMQYKTLVIIIPEGLKTSAWIKKFTISTNKKVYTMYILVIINNFKFIPFSRSTKYAK